MAADPKYPFHEIGSGVALNVRALIRDFIIPHALEFDFSTEEMTDGESLRKVASWLITSKKRFITSRDLARNVWHPARPAARRTPEAHFAAGRGRLAGAEEPGPANREWTVTPVVAAQFERRRQIEEASKTTLAELMGSPRKAP